MNVWLFSPAGLKGSRFPYWSYCLRGGKQQPMEEVAGIFEFRDLDFSHCLALDHFVGK